MTDPFRPPPPVVPGPGTSPGMPSGTPRRPRRTLILTVAGIFLVVILVAVVAGLVLGSGSGADRHAEATPVSRAAEASPSSQPSTDGTMSEGATTSHAPSLPPEPRYAAAWTQLQSLAVKGRAPKTGYQRALFGQAWSDDVDVAFGHNGCDTRNDILRRDLVDIVAKPGTRGCVIAAGTLHDPYTGKTIPFTRGSTSSAVQIDHVVALSDAWQKGAQQLTPEQRVAFANDPANLQATDGRVNQSKGDGDAATWLPPNRAYRCTYAARQIEVKRAYRLWVTAAERDALARVLRGCGAGT